MPTALDSRLGQGLGLCISISQQSPPYAAHSVCWLLSCVQPFVTPWTVAHQAPLSMGFSQQEYWSGVPFPPLGDFPDPGIKPSSPAQQVDSLPLCYLGSSPNGSFVFVRAWVLHLRNYARGCQCVLRALIPGDDAGKAATWARPESCGPRFGSIPGVWDEEGCEVCRRAQIPCGVPGPA